MITLTGLAPRVTHPVVESISTILVSSARPQVSHSDTWWCHDIETFWISHYWPFVRALVTDGFPSQKEENVFFVVSLNKHLKKQSSCWWFEKPRYLCDSNDGQCSLWQGHALNPGISGSFSWAAVSRLFHAWLDCFMVLKPGIGDCLGSQSASGYTQHCWQLHRWFGARLQCLVHPGVRDKRRVSEIDLSQPRHETAFWWRHNWPVTSQLTDRIKRPNYPLELIGIYVNMNTHNKESLTQRCHRSTNVQLCLIFLYISITLHRK